MDTILVCGIQLWFDVQPRTIDYIVDVYDHPHRYNPVFSFRCGNMGSKLEPIVVERVTKWLNS